MTNYRDYALPAWSTSVDAARPSLPNVCDHGACQETKCWGATSSSVNRLRTTVVNSPTSFTYPNLPSTSFAPATLVG